MILTRLLPSCTNWIRHLAGVVPARNVYQFSTIAPFTALPVESTGTSLMHGWDKPMTPVVAKALAQAPG